MKKILMIVIALLFIGCNKITYQGFGNYHNSDKNKYDIIVNGEESYMYCNLFVVIGVDGGYYLITHNSGTEVKIPFGYTKSIEIIQRPTLIEVE